MKKIDIKGTLDGLLGKGRSGKGLYPDNGSYPPQQGGYDNNPQQQGGYSNYPQQQGGYSNYPPQQGGYSNYPQQQGGYSNYPQQQGGYDNYPQQQGGYDNYPQQQGGYSNYPQQGGYDNYPQQGGYDNYPQQGGYSNYPQQQGGYDNYPQQQGGYDNYPPQPQSGRSKPAAFKKGVGIGGLVSGVTGGIKGSVEKIRSKLAKPQKLYSDADIVPDSSARTADLSDIQAAELGAGTARPPLRQQDDFDFLDDGFDPEPRNIYSAQSSAASQGPERFKEAAEAAAAAVLRDGTASRTASRTGDPRRAAAYGREAAMEREAAGRDPAAAEGTSERVNYKFTPDVVYDQHRDDIGYVPPSSAAPRSHLRYKRRNRRPMRMWLKAPLTVLCCTLFFASVISLFFVSMMTSRINYVGDSVHNTVYLSIDEKRALSQEETSIEENENEFTVPTISDRTDKDVKLILLIASDEAFASGRSSNCDSLMLVVIDNRYKQIKLISIMSELYVRIPGYYSNKLGKAFYYDTAKGDYSLSILRQTIYDNFRLNIDNYVVVDYKALETLVNRLGGVPMELTVQEAEYMRSDPKYGLFPRYTYGGHYNMSGAETLNYVRMKKVGDGAFERTLRQRKVFYELVSKLGDLSFVQLSELTYAMLPLLGTDMSKSDVNYYFRHARGISKYQIDQLRIPIEGSFRFGEADVLGRKIEVLVTNYAFTSETLRDYIYDNDSTYQGGAYAEDVVLPDVAPLPEMLEEQEGQ